MDLINILADDLFNLGKTVISIDNQNWKINEIQEYFNENVVLIFDTDTVGCGQYGEENPEEAAQERWKNAFGLLQCITINGNPSLVYAAVPKSAVQKNSSVKKYLFWEKSCKFCNKLLKKKLMKFSNGDIICSECFEKK